MNKLLTLLTTAFIVGLIGCSGSTGPNDGFQGRKIGAWYLTKAQQGNWQGLGGQNKHIISAPKAKAKETTVYDTLLFNHDVPRQALRMYRYPATEPNIISVAYYDSTTTPEQFKIDSIQTEMQLSTPVGTWGQNDHSFGANFKVPFSCDSSYVMPDQQFVTLTFRASNNDTTKVFKFRVDGIIQTGKAMCSDQP